MKTFAQYAFAMTVLLTLTVAVNLATPTAQAVSGNPSVTIANTPLPTTVTNFPATQPVSGAVAVSNFPASQSVSGTVSLAGGTSVALDASHTVTPSSSFGGDSKSAVVTVNAYDGRQPWFLTLPLGSNATLSLNGKRLVIEYISAFISTSGPLAYAEFEANGKSGFKAHAFFAPTGTPSGIDYAVNQQTRMYVDDGDTIVAGAACNGACSLSGFFFVHGYLIDP